MTERRFIPTVDGGCVNIDHVIEAAVDVAEAHGRRGGCVVLVTLPFLGPLGEDYVQRVVYQGSEKRCQAWLTQTFVQAGGAP